MQNVKVLDCTLREGGYINDWIFGEASIKNIIDNLDNSGIDFIECGYLKPSKYSPDKTIFNSPADIDNSNKKFTLMINFGEYDIKDIINPQNITFRIAFKKIQMKEALEYCKAIDNKNIFINPMHTNTYSDEELSDLIKHTNEIQPMALTITDSMGCMRENDLKKILEIITKNLDPNINLCFHSHNNLGQSNSITKFLLENCTDRDLIIDSTLAGIGRGAGNLQTEQITGYLNKVYNKNYKIDLLESLIKTEIQPIYEKNPWGSSVPYYLSGLHKCHPNYAKYLIDKSLTNEKIEEVLKKIPEDKKSTYNESLINQLL